MQKRAKRREGEREDGRERGQKERERERRIITRVDEPRNVRAAEFTHYRNILLVPMVRSGPSGSVVHGEPARRYAVRKHLLYDFGFHPCLGPPPNRPVK